MGRFFIIMKQKEGRNIRQSVLIVDNGYSFFEQLNYSIKTLMRHFPKAQICILTFEYRKALLEKEFSNLKFIIVNEHSPVQRYQIARDMFKIRKRRFDFVLLLSLDISPLLVSLLFLNSNVILYNQWGQWWAIKLRRIGELFKATYAGGKNNFSFKGILKRVGLSFVLLQQNDIGLFRQPILIVDNGYASSGHIYCAIEKTIESFPQSKITLLTSSEREELKKQFPALEFAESEDYIFKRYRIARTMLNLRNQYGYIILLSLDITPLIVSLLFMGGKVILYNQWHQWWMLMPKTTVDYLAQMPRFILKVILNAIIFIYLLISTCGIFLRRSFNVFKTIMLNRGD